MLPANAATITYTVKSGDTLSAIAKKYKVSLASLKSANKIVNANKIKVGRVLRIPSTSSKTRTKTSKIVKPTKTVKKPKTSPKPVVKTAKPAPKPVKPPVVEQPHVDTYTVMAGDNLSLIAKANELTVENIKRYNNLTSDTIYVGQVLRLTASEGYVEQPVSQPAPQLQAVDYITKYNLTAQEKVNFINQVAPDAIQAWKDYKILPSLTIAQAILESYYGFSWLSVNANNYFGIKADYYWTGDYVILPTLEYDVKGVPFTANEKFRKYRSLHDSTVDHTKFLLKPRYANIIGVTDYREATVNIQQDGYATDPNYANLLQSIIKTHNLTQYDVQAGAIAASN